MLVIQPAGIFFVFCNLNTKLCVTCGTIQCIDQCTLKNTENVNWVTSSSRGWNCSKSENIWGFHPPLCFKAEIKFLYYVHIYKQSPWETTDLKQTQMLEFRPLHFQIPMHSWKFFTLAVFVFFSLLSTHVLLFNEFLISTNRWHQNSHQTFFRNLHKNLWMDFKWIGKEGNEESTMTNVKTKFENTFTII